MKRALSPALFAVVVVCFFLPFVSISCQAGAFTEQLEELGEGLGEEAPGELPQGEIEVTATGWQIVTNSPPEPEGLPQEELGPAEQTDEAFPGRIYAILALVAAVLGVVVSILPPRIGPAGATGLGILGAILLFLMKSAIDSEIGAAGAFGFTISYQYGFWLALVLFLGAAAAGVWVLLRPEPTAAAPSGPPPGEPPPGAEGPPAPGRPPPPD